MPPVQLHLVDRVGANLPVGDERTPSPPARDLGHVLRAMDALDSDQVLHARQRATTYGLELGQYLHLHGLVDSETLLRARQRATGTQIADLDHFPPDPRLVDRLGVSKCLRENLLPFRSVGGAILVAAEDPQKARELELGPEPLIPTLANSDQIRAALLDMRAKQLARRAEMRTHEDLSCRKWPLTAVRNFSTVAVFLSVVWAILFPFGFVSAVLFWTIATMLALLAVKLVAAGIYLTHPPVEDDPGTNTLSLTRRPTVSVMVPLFQEKDIAARLVKRLERLTYPKELLEICLVVEAGDEETQATLRETQLPGWFTVVKVPRGQIQTKPRALNYALDFCKGDIIGVYDAEDAPDPDQIDKIVARFQRRGEDVACLQGRLDYYNPRSNWLARCFSIEYATWFRIVLPGLERMGFPVPLGGTTLFFRRSVLEKLGAWDAHNVTEDADLGMRLARMGYRTELVDTVTYEEANCRLWPWVKQRSRWLKGYAVTYAVHMRSPRKLLQDLGPWRFFGMQILFLGTLTQFALAPILWSFWPAILGFWHPFQSVLDPSTLFTIAMIFIGAELLSMAVGMVAVATREKRYLIAWVPTMIGYFPFATIAAFKGLMELRDRPFYWDKTAHGISSGER